jgi:hypothetical protein
VIDLPEDTIEQAEVVWNTATAKAFGPDTHYVSLAEMKVGLAALVEAGHIELAEDFEQVGYVADGAPGLCRISDCGVHRRAVFVRKGSDQ